jgi:hypothetical protein
MIQILRGLRNGVVLALERDTPSLQVATITAAATIARNSVINLMLYMLVIIEALGAQDTGRVSATVGAAVHQIAIGKCITTEFATGLWNGRDKAFFQYTAFKTIVKI